MIHLNLLRNRFQSDAAASDSDALGSISTISLEDAPSGKGKRVFALAAVVVILAGATAGIWYKFFRVSDEDTIAPPTVATSAKPKPDTAPKAAPPQDTTKTAVADSAKSKIDSTPKPQAPKVAEAAKPEPKPEPEPEPEHKPLPPPPASLAPQVVAPSLAGGIVNQVLTESQAKSSSGAHPTRFEDLSAPERVSYQKFAFERILSVVRQVSAPAIRYTRVRIYSPGLLVLQGTSSDSGAVRGLVQGLLAQSLIDTALKIGPKGQFAVAARLPFNASFGGLGGSSEDFAKTITQARDLAQAQNISIAAPKSPSVQNVSGRRRATWKIAGTGAWDAIDKWIASLQSTDCPLGFTTLALAAGPDGKLRIEGQLISYGK